MRQGIAEIFPFKRRELEGILQLICLVREGIENGLQEGSSEGM